MSDKTSIEWTEASWNPIVAHTEGGKRGWHCEKVSDGCVNCYAETMNRRLGTRLPFSSRSRSKVDLSLDEKTLALPLHWQKGRQVFVCSMTDLFADFVPTYWIDRVFAVMLLAPRHVFQVLTKRPQRMREYINAPGRLSEVMEAASTVAFDEYTKRGQELPPTAQFTTRGEDMTVEVACPGWPLQNVMLGISAENQETFDERITKLYLTNARRHWASLEPLLGPIKMHLVPGDDRGSSCSWCNHSSSCDEYCVRNPTWPRTLDWVVVGGDSGHGARPMDLAWARDIQRQCRAGRVAFFMKQVGSNPQSGFRCAGCDEFLDHSQVDEASHGEDRCGPCHPVMLRIASYKGNAIDDIPEDLRVRESPVDAAWTSWRPANVARWEGTTEEA